MISASRGVQEECSRLRSPAASRSHVVSDGTPSGSVMSSELLSTAIDGLRSWAKMATLAGSPGLLQTGLAGVHSAVCVAAFVAGVGGVVIVFAGATAFVLGPLTKGRGRRRKFYGEDLRHAKKKAQAYNGVRLTLKEPIDSLAVRGRVVSMLKKEGAYSLLRSRVLSTTEYYFSDAPDEDVATAIIHHGASGVHEPTVWAAAAEELWAEGLPLRIYVTERGIDLMAHHAIFDGIRGIRLLNELLGNLGRKGAIRPHMLPSCVLACSARAFARVLAYERPRGTLSTRSTANASYHASHYIRVPTELIKRVKETHGVGFAPALQGLILYSLFRCGMPRELHVASTVGFKSDWLARLGSAFNHYGAFPISARDDASPQAVAKQVAAKSRRTGMVAGFPCLLANGSLGGATSSISDLYNAIGAPTFESPGFAASERRQPSCDLTSPKHSGHDPERTGLCVDPVPPARLAPRQMCSSEAGLSSWNPAAATTSIASTSSPTQSPSTYCKPGLRPLQTPSSSTPRTRARRRDPRAPHMWCPGM